MGLARRTGAAKAPAPIAIDVPADTLERADSAQESVSREIRGVLYRRWACPPHAILKTLLPHPEDPRAAARHSPQLSEDGRGRRALRSHGRPTLVPSIDNPVLPSRTSSGTISAAPTSTTWLRWSPDPSDLEQPRDRDRSLHAAPQRSRSRNISKGTSQPRPPIPEADRAKLSDAAKMITYAQQNSEEQTDATRRRPWTTTSRRRRGFPCRRSAPRVATAADVQSRRRRRPPARQGSPLRSIWAALPRPSMPIAQGADAQRHHAGDRGPDTDLLAALDELATVCDPGTRVVVLGTGRRGRAVSRTGPARRQRLRDRAGARCDRRRALDLRPVLRRSEAKVSVGRLDRGRRAPRVASAPRPSPTMSPGPSRATSRLDSVVVDLDLAFGTAGLDYNQDPVQGIANAVFSPDRVRTAPSWSACCRKVRRSPQPAGGTGHARPRLRFRRRSLRRHLRYDAHDHDGPASCSTFRISGPPGPSACWSRADDILIVAERQISPIMRNTKNMIEPVEGPSRPNDRRAALLPEPGRHVEATRDRGQAISPRRSRASRLRRSRSIRRLFGSKPPTTAR